MAVTQTLDEQLARLGSYNRMYNYNKTSWRYLLNSYLGGDDYRRGNHLTRYQLETDTEYSARLLATPLENHCKAVINVYNSFLFREPPERDFGGIENWPEVDAFLEDADFEGRDLNTFMKDVSTWASVFGHCWILVVKPDIGAVTRADEMAQGVRPYVNVLSPLTVLDWKIERLPSGGYAVSYLKYVEEVNGSVQMLKIWTNDTIETWEVDFDSRKILSQSEEPNGLGKIPAVVAYNTRSSVRGLGVSDITDIADLQKFIYNMTSEAEQTMRMDSHPSLVKTPETQAGTGAGSIISIPENLDPGLKPYLLEFNGASVTSIYSAIQHAADAIDAISNTGSVRSRTSTTLSGVAMQTEFQLLNAKLSEKADNLELAEEQIWKLWCEYMGTTWDGEVKYEDSFSIQDEELEYTKLQTAKSAATGPDALNVIDQMIIELLTDDTELEGRVPGPLDAQVGEVTNDVNVLGAAVAPEAPDTTAQSGPASSPEACPVATQDIPTNLKNRQTAITKAHYGPLNPGLPNRTYWMAKAKQFGSTVAEAKTALCSNCSAFNQTQQILDCIDQGIGAGGSGAADAWDTVKAGNLGYCEFWDFKCAGNRTCDAWVAGGPITN